jgi:hypothetical protein
VVHAELRTSVFFWPALFPASSIHRRVSKLFKKLAMDYKLVEEWAQLNTKLEAGWAPYRDLVAQRDEIEKKIPWLKGHGASPYPSKPPPPPPSISSPSKKETIVEPLGSGPGKRTRDEKGARKKLDQVKAQGSPGTSPSATPINKDDSQNFAAAKN